MDNANGIDPDLERVIEAKRPMSKEEQKQIRDLRNSLVSQIDPETLDKDLKRMLQNPGARPLSVQEMSDYLYRTHVSKGGRKRRRTHKRRRSKKRRGSKKRRHSRRH